MLRRCFPYKINSTIVKILDSIFYYIKITTSPRYATLKANVHATLCTNNKRYHYADYLHVISTHFTTLRHSIAIKYMCKLLPLFQPSDTSIYYDCYCSRLCGK